MLTGRFAGIADPTNLTKHETSPLTKLFYLALRNISQKWTMPIRDWKAALTRFTIQFGDRISVN
jgi:transposase-like protein